ncbi:neurexin-1-like [Uloborus diversus]|uniref:neurexin-1-like n=1 Tax=Uloborus diversus TaxID=327109 RepID=UPI00240A3FF4|nr:neurexin-1-like [Uloborus diversus]
MVDGILRLRFNLGGGAMLTNAGRNLHDDRWHRVELIRNVEDTILKVDEDTQSKVTKGTDYQFGNYTSNSFVYIGGIPSWYSAKLTQMSLPSVFFEPHFKGSIRAVVYASEEGPPRHQDMIEFKGIRSNELDACKHHDPCQHGGECISTDSGAICDCGTGDYDGNFCERERTPAEATFRGTEYLSYDLLSLHSEPILASSDQLSLHFKSRQPSGVLLYNGRGEDYLLLALKEGTIVLAIHLGSSSVEKQLRPAKVRFDDNQWHRVLVHRKVREITRATSFCHFSITVDGVYTERGSTAGTFNLLSSSVLFVGGLDHSGGYQGARQHSNFVGCIKKVEFMADSLKLEVIELGRTGNKLIQQQGSVQYLCQEVEAADPITFTNKESFLALPSWDAARSGSIAFKLRTNEANGVLMYNTGTTAQGDFFAFELLDGHVFLLLNLGSGAVKVKATTRRVDDGQWHIVSLKRNGKSGRVTVDESAVDFITPGNSNQLDLEGPLYVGGVGTSAQGVLIPSELWSGSLRYGYVGCMRDLVINGRAVDIAGVSQKQDSGSIRPACHTSTPQCDNQPCLNGGLCLEGWNHYTCDCSHTSYSGTVCAKDATTLSFDGTQSMRIALSELPTQAEDIRLRFRTTRPSGLLFATASDRSANTHLSAALEAGRLKLVLNLGDGNKVFFVGQGLNDDQWHTLRVTRRGQSMDVKVDSEATTRELSGLNVNLDIQTLNIGAIGSERTSSTITSTSSSKEVPNFVGHMQHFIFNGQHFFDMARSGQMTNFKVTAKFGKKDEIVHHPVTFKSKFTFIGLSQLKAYSSMNLYFQFKTLEPNGLILYNGGKGQDFIAIELVDGHLHYIFNLGDGPRKVRSNTRTTLNDNHWHAVTIGRPSVKQHTLMVDDMIATVASTGSNVHLDLDGLLYLGGVPRSTYAGQLPKLVQSRHGFEGCLASLDLNGETVDPITDAVVPSTLVSTGCAGPVTKCSTSACANRGICVQMWNSYTCDCDMTSFTGPTCSDESVSYKFGQRGGLITFSFSSDKRPDTKSDLLALGFISSTDNAVLVRIDSGSSNDYMELEIVDGNVFMVYNMGTEDHPIGELSVNVNDNQYHVVRFTRSGPNSTIQIDDHNVRTKQPTGRQHTIFNSHSKIQVGGKFNSVKNRIERPFHGVISGLVFGSNRILDMAAENDPRVEVQEDVELLIAIPPGGPTTESSEEENSSTTDPTEPTEEVIFSGAGSGCWDDEDDCESANNERHEELITPEFVSPTPEDFSEPRREDTCEDDDDDCIDIGSGISEGEVARPEDILLTVPAHSGRVPPASSPVPPVLVVSPPLPKTTRVPAVVYEVPIPGLGTNSGKDYQRPTQRSRSSADNTALVIGVIAGVLIAIVLIALIVYKLRNRTEGSYKVDESKNYQFGAIAASPAFLNGPMPPHMNGLGKGHPEKTPKKKKGGKDLKEWYV